MVEKYHRNPAKPAHEDRSEIIFMVGDDKILVTYHTEDTKISASTREFVKPSNAEEKGAMLIMTPDMHSTFQVRTRWRGGGFSRQTGQRCPVDFSRTNHSRKEPTSYRSTLMPGRRSRWNCINCWPSSSGPKTSAATKSETLSWR